MNALLKLLTRNSPYHAYSVYLEHEIDRTRAEVERLERDRATLRERLDKDRLELQTYLEAQALKEQTS